jgi:hypothetical protein
MPGTSSEPLLLRGKSAPNLISEIVLFDGRKLLINLVTGIPQVVNVDAACRGPVTFPNHVRQVMPCLPETLVVFGGEES